MNTLTLDVAGLEDALVAFKAAWTSGHAETGARISFASPELLWRVLTESRWQLLRAMTGQGARTVPEAAQRVDRDITAVENDVEALATAGLLRGTADGRFDFPFDAIRVGFMLRAA